MRRALFQPVMLLYNIGIWLYIAAISIVSPINRKARMMRRGRKHIFRRLAEAMRGGQRVVWVHAASLGEFEQGRPVIEAIRERYPQYKILLTFFSPSGYEMRKDYPGADYVFYLPYDTPRAARRFVDMVRPEVTVFIKYEFWLNYLNALRRRGCRTFIISAIFRSNSAFFKWYGGIFRRGLKAFTRLFVQDEASVELLASIGITDVTVAGDTRFDRVAAIAAAAQRIEQVERFADGEKVFIAGSTWPPDEELLMKLSAAHPEVKFLIAPHEISEQRISKLVAACPRPYVRYTQLAHGGQIPADTRIFILDTIGLLSSAYRYAAYAYIGGGFGVGIHNTLEAATFGLPMAFGPNYAKFKEARDLVEINAARSVGNYEQLDEWFTALSSDPQLYAETKAKALSYVAFNTGATDKFLEAAFPPRNTK